MRKDDGHDTVIFKMIEIMEQECKISLGLWRNAEILIPWIELFVLRIPLLGIRRIADHGIHLHKLISSLFLVLFKERPVVLQCISVSHIDIGRLDSSHDQIHPGQIKCILFQFLRVIINLSITAYIFCSRSADVY